MNQEKNEVSKVFKEIDKTIQVIGTEKLIEIMKHARIFTESISQEQVNRALMVIEVVCDEFKISLSQFFDSKRKANRRTVIGISAFLIQKEMNLDNSDISYIFKKSDEVVSLYKQEIIRLNPNHPQDKQILEKISIITNKLQNDK